MVRSALKGDDYMKSSKVRGATVLNRSADRNEEAEQLEAKLRDESTKRKERFIKLGLDKTEGKFSKIPDRIAQSDHWLRNEPIPHGLELFPPDRSLWHMRYADLFYPMAKGGPLFLDTPGSPTEVTYCEEKIKAYRTKGIRYSYILSQDDEIDVLLRLDPNIGLPSGKGASA
jgi:hypothetical protein